MIYYLPLEHLEERYTIHLDETISEYLLGNNIPHIKIYPEDLKKKRIVRGSFLDAPFTTMFKCEQIKELANYYNTDKIKDNDIIFVSDLWFPGLESVAYMNYFCDKKVKLRGILHAGSFTDTDFVRNMERWAKNFEDIICDITDKIFCGSKFIKRDVLRKRIVNPDKLIVTGLPLDYKHLDDMKNKVYQKTNIVIFNGRNVDEKQPWLFKELKKRFSKDIRFINTQEEMYSKGDYYKLLAESKVVVSFALQENFGFGINEAVYLGCIPILPNRLVYPEYYSKEYLYNNFEDCVSKVRNALEEKLRVPVVKDFRNCVKEWFK